MNMSVRGRHMDVTPKIRDYAEEKIGRVGKILNHGLMDIEIELWTEKNPSIAANQVAEVTLFTKGPVIRAREAAGDMFAAIDMVSDKLERQVSRYKDRLVDRHTKRASVGEVPVMPTTLPGEAEEPEPGVVKTKRVHLKPMTMDEAILQLELLGHDFFVFTSAEDDEVAVLYRRKDGDYGLIEPRIGG